MRGRVAGFLCCPGEQVLGQGLAGKQIVIRIDAGVDQPDRNAAARFGTGAMLQLKLCPRPVRPDCGQPPLILEVFLAAVVLRDCVSSSSYFSGDAPGPQSECNSAVAVAVVVVVAAAAVAVAVAAVAVVVVVVVVAVAVAVVAAVAAVVAAAVLSFGEAETVAAPATPASPLPLRHRRRNPREAVTLRERWSTPAPAWTS